MAASDKYSDQQLESLLAPIALYPDELLTHVLMAATYPTEIVSAHRWWEEGGNRSLQGAGLEAALARKAPARVYPRRLDGAAEAHLVAVACSDPPAGHERWTLRLLADELVRLEVVPTVSYETVRRTLEQTSSSRG